METIATRVCILYYSTLIKNKDLDFLYAEEKANNYFYPNFSANVSWAGLVYFIKFRTFHKWNFLCKSLYII